MTKTAADRDSGVRLDVFVASMLDISRSVAFLAASASSVQLKSVVSVMRTRSSTLMLLVIRLPVLVIAFPPVMWMRSRIGS